MLFLGFVGGWKQDLMMVLVNCPEFSEKNWPLFGSVVGRGAKIVDIRRHMSAIMKGLTSPSFATSYQPTDIGEELISQGYGPFDFKNRSFPAPVEMQLPQSEIARRNLKELIAWLCNVVTSKETKPENLDPLRGQDPIFYGLSTQKGNRKTGK